MKIDRFNEVVSDQMNHCVKVLAEKVKEYVFSDYRLDHFKNSAAEQGINPKQALWGMTSKHLTSLGGMCKAENGKYPPKVWSEKITDTMNYMLLLLAIVTEEVNSEKH